MKIDITVYRNQTFDGLSSEYQIHIARQNSILRRNPVSNYVQRSKGGLSSSYLAPKQFIRSIMTWTWPFNWKIHTPMYKFDATVRSFQRLDFSPPSNIGSVARRITPLENPPRSVLRSLYTFVLATAQCLAYAACFCPSANIFCSRTSSFDAVSRGKKQKNDKKEIRGKNVTEMP